MNRELKFRLWNTVRKDMNYDGGMQMLGNKLIQDEHNILMQFTSLKDKQGKEIFEGDIAKAYKSKGRLEALQFTIFEVKFIEGNFELCKDYEIENLGTLCSYNCLEVIGNIYENPELLNDASREDVAGVLKE